MIKRTGLAALAAATTMALSGAAAPALANGVAHWTNRECAAYVRAFHKHHRHATKAQLANANRVLAVYRCTQRVK
jgi:hypothetical protein